MYCVNVMKFGVPESCIRFLNTEHQDKDKDVKLENSIMQHHFNAKIILHVPDTPSLPNKLLTTFSEDTSFYYVQNLLVKDLCEESFIQAFVKCGNVYGYSFRTLLDIDDCAAFCPTGKLFLLLNYPKYYELGISGKLSSHILRKPKSKYVVEINTLEDGFSANKKLYQKVHRALAACPLEFDFYFTWTPHDEDVCPSSLAKYFHDKGYNVEEVGPVMKQVLRSDISIPLIEDDNDPESLLEWLGMQAMDTSTDTPSEDSTDLSSMCVSHVEGFFTPLHVKKLVDELREWLFQKEVASTPWVAITVFGPPDCLISWSNSENSYKMNGDNFYTLVICREKVLFYTVEESKQPQRFYDKSSNK